MTPCDELLLHIKLAGIREPLTEYKFHDERRWRFDLAWPEKMLAVEVHGAVYQQGRHTRGKGFTNDREKMNEAILLGWRLLEVTPAQIKNGKALQWIEKGLNN